MCKQYLWVIYAASISGAVQSLVWIVLGLVGALVHLCTIPVAPYKDRSDFFRVTLVKLYFEGRKCTPDGSYLGQFDKDYKGDMNLLQQELVFGVMIAYVILNAFLFLLSINFYRRRTAHNKRGIALKWSALSLVICVVDVLFTYAFVLDILTLRDYLSKADENMLPPELNEIPYIPLTMALLASRFFAGWLWNFILAFIIFMDALCCRNIISEPPKEEIKEQQNKEVEKNKQEEEEEKPQNGEEVTKSSSNYFIPTLQDYIEYKNTMEATTRFNIPEERRSPGKANMDQRWSTALPETYWHLGLRNKECDNEGYVSDEKPSQPDFNHDLKNFESGQRKIKIVRPPMGKPVSIPVPPPLPPSGFCNC